MDYRDPDVPDARQVAEALTFDYTEEDWIKIEKSIRHLRPTQAELEDVRTRLRFHIRETYLLAGLNRPGMVVIDKLITKHWARIAKLLDDAHESLFAIERLTSKKGLHPEKYWEYQIALTKLAGIAQGLAAPKIDEGFPKASPRGWFQFEVLTIWMGLGGELRISRHPRTKKITGPLARYFAAVTGPIPGYRGSLESLPDILARQKPMMLKMVNYRAKARAAAVATKRESLHEDEEMPDEPCEP